MVLVDQKNEKKKGNEKIENREGQRAKNSYCGYWLGGCYGWPSKKERGIMLKSLMR